MNGVRAVLYRELKIYSRRWPRHAASYAVSPFLYLLVFGWGVGRGVQMGGVNYLAFILPGLATMSSMTQSYGIATEVNIARFYLRVFEEYQMAPISSWEIVLGEVFYGMLRGTAAATAVIVLGALFGVNVIPTPGLVALHLAHTFTFASAAMVSAMYVKSHADQGHINTFFIVPMSFLCGTFFPLDRLPEWAQVVARCLPLTHTNVVMRSLLLDQPTPWGSVAALVAFGAIFFGGAVYLVRRASL